MRYITATEANQNLSRVLRDVAAGASYTVTSRGKPVAEIRAPDFNADLDKAEKRKRMEAMLERMKQLPGVITGPYTRDDIYDRNW
jgi:antitoxin (DNA-binding transcriptional repressor) of toxin-antitoxin stability system